MTVAESQAAKPLHIRVVSVEGADTIEALAGRMAMPDHALERFRILNGFEPNERPTPGQSVKLVVE
jgi:predicted Zn-dependent protease